jgi:probable phosphoglycerate mutase
VNARDPLVERMFREQRWDVLPNAEPMTDFTSRVERGLNLVVAATGGGRSAAVFVHSAVIAEACRQATGSRGLAFLGNENGALTRLVRMADGGWLLRSFNETTHLMEGMR